MCLDGIAGDALVEGHHRAGQRTDAVLQRQRKGRSAPFELARDEPLDAVNGSRVDCAAVEQVARRVH